MNEFLNKAISQKLSKEKGFGIEVFIYSLNESHRILLKSFKDGNEISLSQSFHHFTLEDAIDRCFEPLQRHIKNFEKLKFENTSALRSFLDIHMGLKGNFEDYYNYHYLSDVIKEGILDKIIHNSSNKEEALKYLNDNYFDLVSI